MYIYIHVFGSFGSGNCNVSYDKYDIMKNKRKCHIVRIDSL